MLRTFNYTNRRRIDQKDVTIRLTEMGDGIPRLHADLRFDAARYPADSKVYIEAWHKETRQRFSFGTVGRIVPPASNSLDQLDLTGITQFRVLVVDESSKHSLILGSGEGFKAQGGEDDCENRSSLLAVVARPMGALTWMVEFSKEGSPTLAVNKNIPGALEKMRSNAIFQALILPAAMRVILFYLITSEEVDEDSEPYQRWRSFALQFTDSWPESKNAESLDDWLDEVIRQFSTRFDFCNRLVDALREDE